MRTCEDLGIQLDAGKSVMRAQRPKILGGELDAVQDCLLQDCGKALKLITKTLALNTLPSRTDGM